LDTDERTCIPDDAATHLDCQAGAMNITIDSCLFDHETYAMHLFDQECRGSGSMDEGGFNLFTKLDECDTALAFIDDNAIFKQTVYGYAIAGDSGIFLGRPVELDYTCTYQTEYNTDGDDIIVANVEATTNRYGSGQFEFEVDFYTDSTFETKSTANDVITVGEQVFFAVTSVNLPSSVSFSVTDCTVTNSATDMSYYIIENFCSDSYTNTHFMSDNYQKQQVSMSYQVRII
jgi:hypothetical protein